MSRKHGWLLEWFERGGDAFVDRTDLEDVDAGWLRELFGEASIDKMMCLSYLVTDSVAEQLQLHVSVTIEPERFDYFVSGWSERGFHTPGGWSPPPRDPPAFIEGPVRIRPDRLWVGAARGALPGWSAAADIYT
jgi:hypothetical protein